MKANDLLDLMGEVEDEYIHDANIDPTLKTATLPNRMRKYAVIAACLALVVGVGSFILPRIGGAAGGADCKQGQFSHFCHFTFTPLILNVINRVIPVQRRPRFAGGALRLPP